MGKNNRYRQAGGRRVGTLDVLGWPAADRYRQAGGRLSVPLEAALDTGFWLPYVNNSHLPYVHKVMTGYHSNRGAVLAGLGALGAAGLTAGGYHLRKRLRGKNTSQIEMGKNQRQIESSQKGGFLMPLAMRAKLFDPKALKRKALNFGKRSIGRMMQSEVVKKNSGKIIGEFGRLLQQSGSGRRSAGGRRGRALDVLGAAADIANVIHEERRLRRIESELNKQRQRGGLNPWKAMRMLRKRK